MIVPSWLLIGFFVATVVIIIMMVRSTPTLGGKRLDRAVTPDAVSHVLDGMNAGHRAAHIRNTQTLDRAFPIAYGGLFVGLALSGFGAWFAVPAILAVAIDFRENALIVRLLSSPAPETEKRLIRDKATISKLKFGLFGIAALIAGAAAFDLIF